MKALIDGDLFGYEMGSLKDEDTGELIPFEMCWRAVQNKIESIVEAVEADSFTIFLSSQEEPTWRFKRATILPYKGNREGSEKPEHWAMIRENVELSYPCHIAKGIEADDAMSIEQYNDYFQSVGLGPDSFNCNTIICSRDKDLNMVPGWHYGWACGNQKEKPLWFQDRIGGLRCFYKQLITGDKADNILGLFGVGDKSAHVKKLEDMTTEGEMFNHVMKLYSDRFGSYAEHFLIENGQLLFMQRHEEERWQLPR